jgi:polysaccharide export outer membrane protein
MARSAAAAFAVLVAAGFAGCAGLARAEQDAPPAFSETAPAYRLFPGDRLEVTNLSAPDLSRIVTVGPDGRIDLPLIPPVMAAERTIEELRADLVAAYALELRTPEIDVGAIEFGSQQIFVGGEVARPGVFPISGPVDALQAVAMAGGFQTSANRGQAMILSRAPGRPARMQIVDLRQSALRRAEAPLPVLGRYDVLYVPRSRISQVNLFVQQYVRDALPIQFSLFYDLAGNN